MRQDCEVSYDQQLRKHFKKVYFLTKVGYNILCNAEFALALASPWLRRFYL